MGAMSVLAGTSVRRTAARFAVCTLLTASAVPALSSVATADTGAVSNSAASNSASVPICHATSSDSQPYIQATVDPNATGKNGLATHLSHTGPVWDSTLKASHTAWGDIIPPVPGYTATGLNWDAAGQAIWNNGCGIPAAPPPPAGTPDLAIQKTGTATGQPGDAVTYTLTVTNNATATTGSTTVTDTLPAALNPGTMTGPSGWTCGASASQAPSCTTSSPVPANASLSFTVTTTIAAGAAPGTATDSASVSNSGDSNSANNTATFDTTITALPTAASATATATCTALGAHLVPSNAAGGTTFTVVEPGGSHSVSTTTAKDVSYTPAAGATITVSANGSQLASAKAPAACPTTPPNGGGGGGGGGGTPPVVTPPVVTPPVVTPPGVAAPTATASNACKTGITVVLGNTAGTAGAVFTVTGTKGATHTIPVAAGQSVTKSYAVTEDTTGTVTVKAAGLTKSFTYAKNCAKVLGEKQTKTPKHHAHQPTVKPVVQGEKVTQLPFTGFNAGHAMLQAAMLMLLGTVICATAGRRRMPAGRHRR